MTVSIEGNPALTLRAWAKAYRDWPMEFRFLSDPHAEFFPRDLDRAADVIERLRAALREVRGYIKNCDHEPAMDTIDAALGVEQKARPKED